MISPLIQRQILQTASVETVRLAMEGHAQVQQEKARQQSLDAKLAETALEIVNVEEADVLRLSERQGRGRGRGAGQEKAGEPDGDGPEDDSAEGAGPHLDLLA